jgi:hypothetical protein
LLWQLCWPCLGWRCWRCLYGAAIAIRE